MLTASQSPLPQLAIMSTPAAAEAVMSIPPQHQEQQPGMEAEMTPKPEFIRDSVTR
jgi:hypothetical protein